LTELVFLNKALLRKLQSLQAAQKQQAAQNAAPGASTTSSYVDSRETGNEQLKGDKERQDFSPKLIQQSIQCGSDHFDPFRWWFRSMKIKIGRLRFAIRGGKLMLFFSLFFWVSFLLRKRGGIFKRLVSFFLFFTVASGTWFQGLGCL
jgi:hypothetical protein